MEIIHRTVVEAYHRERIRVFGNGTAEATGWKDANLVAVRYELLYLPEMNGKRILDLGCGHGAFRKYLEAMNWQGTYTGIDLLPEFIENANEKYGHLPNTTFLAGDFSQLRLPECDYIIGSGAFTYGAPNGLDNRNYNMAMMARTFRHAKKGLVFNLLNYETADEPDHTLLLAYRINDIEQLAEELSADARMLTDERVPHEMTFHFLSS